MNPRQVAALLAGPALCAAVYLAPTPAGLAPEGQAALAVLAFCVVWWLLSPVALAVTSLAGLALLPVLGALDVQTALSLFGNQAVFFVIGVFLIAAVMQQTGLSTRLSLLVLRRFAQSEHVLCLAVLLLSWAMCVVVVSHAVAAIMLPIVLEIIRALNLGARSRTARRLLLSLAWGTICGSNLTLMSSARASLALQLYGGYLAEANLPDAPMGFAEYSVASVPISLFTLVAAGAVLSWTGRPEGLDLAPAVQALDAKVRQMGPAKRTEWVTGGVVILMVLCMILAGPKWMGIVALLASTTLFALQVLQWEDAERYVNWGVALMYGGAIAIGSALHSTGATTWVAGHLPIESLGPTGAIALFALVGAGFTEVVSNSAVMAVVMPIALPVADSVGLDPRAMAYLLPLSAGFAFVLPTSTPALAMVFGTGYLKIKHLLPGFIVAGLAIVALVLLARYAWPHLGLSVLASPLPGAP